jgi:hypothetical protein
MPTGVLGAEPVPGRALLTSSVYTKERQRSFSIFASSAGSVLRRVLLRVQFFSSFLRVRRKQIIPPTFPYCRNERRK